MLDTVFTQVRIWNVERSQKEIISNMRLVDGIAGQPGLVAYWKFDDPNMCALTMLGIPCMPIQCTTVRMSLLTDSQAGPGQKPFCVPEAPDFATPQNLEQSACQS